QSNSSKRSRNQSSRLRWPGTSGTSTSHLVARSRFGSAKAHIKEERSSSSISPLSASMSASPFSLLSTPAHVGGAYSAFRSMVDRSRSSQKRHQPSASASD